MLIEKHPFHILGVTAQSSRQEILERAEILRNQLDPELISACRTEVTHPARRIAAEVAWFPGVSPLKLSALLAAIQDDRTSLAELETNFSGVDTLGEFNARAYWLLQRKTVCLVDLWRAIESMRHNVEAVDGELVAYVLNVDRSLAGLPEITDSTGIANAVKRRGEAVADSLAAQWSNEQHFNQLLTQSIDVDLKCRDLIVSEFIGYLVGRYEIEIQPLLLSCGEQILSLCQRVLESAPGLTTTAALSELDHTIRKWGGLAEPIQLLAKSRGLECQLPNFRWALQVSLTTTALANERGLYREAECITRLLYQTVHPFMAGFLERELKRLASLQAEKELRAKQEEERRARRERSREREKAQAASASASQATAAVFSMDGPFESRCAIADLKAVVEAAIYLTDEPLTAQQIASALDQPLDRIKEILAKLVADYGAPDRGLSIRELAGGYKMATKPEYHESISKFVKKLQAPLKLSLAALETLAVVAYKQPITAPEIMEIRGVQGAGVLKTLLGRKLVAAERRKDVIGGPTRYITTREFLIQFGLDSLADLPTLIEFLKLYYPVL